MKEAPGAVCAGCLFSLLFWTPGQSIDEMPLKVFAAIAKIKPMGSLQARKGSKGAVSLFWRYSLGTASERVLVGLYDPAAPPKSLNPTQRGYSIAAAIRAAEKLATEHHNSRDEGGRPALVAAQREAERAASEASEQAASASLENQRLPHGIQLLRLPEALVFDAQDLVEGDSGGSDAHGSVLAGCCAGGTGAESLRLNPAGHPCDSWT